MRCANGSWCGKNGSAFQSFQGGANATFKVAGWFNQERRVAPVSRIQTVDTERGPFEQIFGITKVTVTTASAAGPLTIHGLDQDTAAQLVDALTADTQATREDGT